MADSSDNQASESVSVEFERHESAQFEDEEGSGDITTEDDSQTADKDTGEIELTAEALTVPYLTIPHSKEPG